MRKIIYLFALVMMVNGCATIPSFGEKSTLLKIGMSKSEVSKILGTPKTTSVKKLDDGIEEKWMYWSKSRVGYMVFDDPSMSGSSNRLSVTFKNEVLQSWGDQLDFSNMMGQNTQNMKEIMKNMQPIQIEQKVYQGDKPKSEK
jgi:outer membrane protein assembly factor BamE (lipoprotein component of BamABCDE complex)